MRSDALAELSTQTFDVLIIGGGINGAGIARDAAMRGLRVALVEQNDFASGTSSRSSRLVHGGVRYLEHGELRLVFESSRERRTLLRVAPHLVRPLAFTWPVYRGARVPRWKLAIALTLYDLLALFRNVRRHKRLSAQDVQRAEPKLGTAGLLGGAQYWDAATDDARLTLANVIAAQQAGAVVVNHAAVSSLTFDGDRVAGAVVRDRDTAGGDITIHARAVVNATGPWSDRVESMLHATKTAVRGSKGVHISVARERIGNSAALTLTAPQDGRVMFVLPAGAFAIIGTTDTYEDADPDDVRPNERDVQYLLDAANHYFPDANLLAADVVSAWAGVRPLARTSAGDGRAPGAVSREHAIVETAPALLRVTGGKLTTYRSMSAEVVDAIERVLQSPPARCRTAEVALPGGDISDLAATIADASAAIGQADVASRLVRAHGSNWRTVWSLAEREAVLAERVSPAHPYLIAELRYAVDAEMARTLGDLLIRRIPLAFELPDHAMASARRLAPLVSEWLGAPPGWGAEAVTAFDEEVARHFEIGAPSGFTARLP